MRRKYRVSLALVMVGLAGCVGNDGEGGLGFILPGDDSLCTLEARAGINVEVRDATTGAPAAFGATGEIRDGD